ncbi:MAG: carbamoyltransferase HypF [Eubacteriales bacterium]|nr:carbamoyltransferase HypF [Eubacteriales bacterium]
MILKINGIVQGVGFRPFIHKLVREYHLCGYIKNTNHGVLLELEGEPGELRRFAEEIPRKAPKLSRIEKLEAEYGLQLCGYSEFEIRESNSGSSRDTLISPDICICDDCLREFRSPENRRYRYPFINCTNCGPRFTIIRDIPYDRFSTSMKDFRMCDSCDSEYHDITDRRYHAQPDCCPDCGPEVFFKSDAGTQAVFSGEDAVRAAGDYLRSGKIVAVKGLGGFHLACRCDEPEIIRELRRRKHRDEKPFAVMCRDVESAGKLCRISPGEERVLTGPERPIVLCAKNIGSGNDQFSESLREISENGDIGIMLPYTPLHYLLFGDDTEMLIMTSANLSDLPVIYQNEEAFEALRGIADGFLFHNRDIVTRCDDSLCRVRNGSEYFLRRSRGYVPSPLKTDSSFPVLACGAEQKASFSLSKGNYVFQSQHIGDLKNMETLDFYRSQITHFERMFDISPEFIACDLHPDYMSSEYAEELGQERQIPVYRIQHHHAHMASCMADNQLNGDVIGLIWDGTGLGTDGRIWGGECLTGGYGSFTRFGSIRPIPLIGGDRAIKETDRVAYAMLREAGRQTEESARSEFEAMLSSGFNCPLSSGMGRLFDGAAAILGIKKKASYEGQGAVLLEASAGKTGIEDLYSPAFYTRPDGNGNEIPMIYDWRPAVSGILDDLSAGLDRGVIAAKFMNSLIEAAVVQCSAAREFSGLNRVVLSGGVFQNMYLMRRLPERLSEEDFEVFCHRRVSCNDEGISFGQLAAADYQIKKGNSYVSSGSDAN